MSKCVRGGLVLLALVCLRQVVTVTSLLLLKGGPVRGQMKVITYTERCRHVGDWLHVAGEVNQSLAVTHVMVGWSCTLSLI